MSSRTKQRLLLWGSAFVLAAGVAAILIVFVGNTGSDKLTKPTFTPGAPSVVKQPKPVKLEPEVREVAGQFILTAVQRKNLDQAWALVGPQIRQDLTYKQWLTGDIPVVPFLDPIKIAPMKVDLSTKDYALLEVILLPVKGRSAIFDIELTKMKQDGKKQWLVTSWVPRSHPTIPTNQSS